MISSNYLARERLHAVLLWLPPWDVGATMSMRERRRLSEWQEPRGCLTASGAADYLLASQTPELPNQSYGVVCSRLEGSASNPAAKPGATTAVDCTDFHFDLLVDIAVERLWQIRKTELAMCGINDTKVETKFSDEVNDENIRLKVTSSSLPSSNAESGLQNC
jgi:hypothetical protein